MEAITRWLSPPEFEGNDEKTHQAMLINTIGIMCIVFILIVMAGALLGGNTPAVTLIIDTVACVVILQVLRWLRDGRVGLAGLTLVIFGLVYLIGATASIGTIRTPTAAIFVFWVLMTGLLYALPGILIGTGTASLAIAGLIIAENSGWLRHPHDSVGVTQWTTFTALFGFTSGLTYYITRGTRRALTLAENEIEQRKRVEAALMDSEKRYRALVEWTPDPIVVYRGGKILYVNPAATNMFAADNASQLIGSAMLDRVHPDSRHAVLTRISDFADRGLNSPMVELQLLRLDGTVMDVELHGANTSFDGEPALYASIRNITDRKLVENKLRLSASVFQNAREGITIADREGTILDVNESFTRITGFSHEEAVGRNSRILRSDRQSSEFYSAMWRTLLDTGHWAGEIWNKRKSGEVYPELLTITAVNDAHGTVQQYVALFTDITVRKQMEDKIRQLAYSDSLTALPNRHTLNDRLAQAVASGKRSKRYGALMVLDLDNFKPLNDTHGHSAGDLLLKEAAVRMVDCVRAVDTVARIGGDEFVVLLSELDADKIESTAQARVIAEKIRSALAAPYFLPLTQNAQETQPIEHRCSASIGVAMFMGQDADPEDVLKWSDAAMYQAKNRGRNSIAFHSPQASAS